MPKGDLLEAWKMSHSANMYLLDAIDAADLEDRYSGRTRTVRDQFTHIHNVRHRWLSVSAPDLAKTLVKFGKRETPEKAVLYDALEASAVAVGKFLAECVEKGKVKNWKGGPASFLGYLIAHEAHHRGLAMVALRLSGHKMDQEVIYGQWEWGKM